MFLGVLLLLQSGSPAVRPADPQTIDTVIVENRNIFDREDAAPDWVAHLANKLHMRTRQWVIRKRLLLNRGDPFDLARVEESERALRNLGVFRQVRVDTRSRVLRERFAEAAAEERSGVARILSALGVPHAVLSTSGDWLRPLAAFLGGRR